MEEKELTDEEIVKVMKCCAERCLYCDECPLREDSWCSNKVLPMGIDLINRQKAEIERLTEESIQKGAELFDTRMELEDCETSNKQLRTMNSNLIEQNAELKKQVDELKEKQVIECHGMLKGCDLVKQAVKDTAKEILQIAEQHANGYENDLDRFMLAVSERYGVEVE